MKNILVFRSKIQIKTQNLEDIFLTKNEVMEQCAKKTPDECILGWLSGNTTFEYRLADLTPAVGYIQKASYQISGFQCRKRPIAKAAKFWPQQYWRPKNGGRPNKLKLKFYYANRPCRFQKQFQNHCKSSNKKVLLAISFNLFI